MPRSKTLLYIAAAFAAAYVLNEWVLPWWDARRPPDSTDDEHPPPSIEVDPAAEAPAPHAEQTRSLPPLRTHSLPPNGRAISLAINPDAMASSTSLHTLSTVDADDDRASQSNTDGDSEPFVDVLSPSPAHVISRRRSFRNHDLFAASHISFSELGSLVAPENEHH